MKNIETGIIIGFKINKNKNFQGLIKALKIKTQDDIIKVTGLDPVDQVQIDESYLYKNIKFERSGKIGKFRSW